MTTSERKKQALGPTPSVGKGRSSFNAIVPGKLLQRGQILTWQRGVKHEALAAQGITAVINFWPKADADLSDAPIDWYWFIPSDKSKQMLDPKIELAAKHVAEYLASDPKHCALVLCEAGKTRSAFFCIMIVKHLLSVSWQEAWDQVNANLPAISLKGFMSDWLQERV